MSNGQRRAQRVQVGSRVKVCMDRYDWLLEDMAIWDSEQRVLKDVYMYGIVKAKTRTHVHVELPAAEQQFQIPLERVCRAERKDLCPPTFVLFDKEIKVVHGLKIPAQHIPDDYFSTRADAERAVQVLASKTGFSHVI